MLSLSVSETMIEDKLTTNYRRFYGRTLPDIEESLNTSYFLYEILQMCPPYLSNEEINPYHKESKIIHDTFLRISQEEKDVVNEYAKISGRSLYRVPLLKSISKANDCAGVMPGLVEFESYDDDEISFRVRLNLGISGETRLPRGQFVNEDTLRYSHILEPYTDFVQYTQSNYKEHADSVLWFLKHNVQYHEEKIASYIQLKNVNEIPDKKYIKSKMLYKDFYSTTATPTRKKISYTYTMRLDENERFVSDRSDFNLNDYIHYFNHALQLMYQYRINCSTDTIYNSYVNSQITNKEKRYDYFPILDDLPELDRDCIDQVGDTSSTFIENDEYVISFSRSEYYNFANNGICSYIYYVGRLYHIKEKIDISFILFSIRDSSSLLFDCDSYHEIF